MECLLLDACTAAGSGKLWCRTVGGPAAAGRELSLRRPVVPAAAASYVLLSLALRDMRADAGSDRLALALLALWGPALAVEGCRGGSCTGPAACSRCSGSGGSSKAADAEWP
jgi:hypothetical protein